MSLFSHSGSKGHERGVVPAPADSEIRHKGSVLQLIAEFRSNGTPPPEDLEQEFQSLFHIVKNGKPQADDAETAETA